MLDWLETPHPSSGLQFLPLIPGIGGSQTRQSSATHMAFGGTSAGNGSPVLLATKENYADQAGPEAALLHNHVQSDMGASLLLDPSFQVPPPAPPPKQPLPPIPLTFL